MTALTPPVGLADAVVPTPPATQQMLAERSGELYVCECSGMSCCIYSSVRVFT